MENIIDLDELEDSIEDEEEEKIENRFVEIGENEINEYPIENKFRDNIKKKWNNLIFRKVENVISKEHDIEDVIYYYVVPPSIIQKISKVFREKKLEKIIPEDFLSYFDDATLYEWKILKDIETYALILSKTLKKSELSRFDFFNLGGNVLTRHYTNTREAYRDVEQEEDDYEYKTGLKINRRNNIQILYKNYVGNTKKDKLTKHDTYDGSILFSSKRFAEIDLSKNPTLDFNEVSNIQRAPRRGQLLCGLVDYKNNELVYDKWFICSYQFYLLWLMIFEPDNEQIPKTWQDKMKELNTYKIWNMYNLSLNERLKKFQYRVYETAAMEYGDRYQIIAKFCFDQKYIDEWKLKINERIEHNNKCRIDCIKFNPSFEENLYLNVINMNFPETNRKKFTITRANKREKSPKYIEEGELSKNIEENKPRYVVKTRSTREESPKYIEEGELPKNVEENKHKSTREKSPKYVEENKPRYVVKTRSTREESPQYIEEGELPKYVEENKPRYVVKTRSTREESPKYREENKPRYVVKTRSTREESPKYREENKPRYTGEESHRYRQQSKPRYPREESPRYREENKPRYVVKPRYTREKSPIEYYRNRNEPYDKYF